MKGKCCIPEKKIQINCSCGAFLHHYVTKLLQIHLFAVPASQMLTLDDQYIARWYDNSCLYLIQCPLHCCHKSGKSGSINTATSSH